MSFVFLSVYFLFSNELGQKTSLFIVNGNTSGVHCFIFERCMIIGKNDCGHISRNCVCKVAQGGGEQVFFAIQRDLLMPAATMNRSGRR